MRKPKIAVAISGGVDSSTIAALLKNQGNEIFGITMYLHEHSNKAVEDAKKVCQQLDIDHFVCDLSKEFLEKVIRVFKDYYKNGLTPNPCAICNRDIKLGLLLEKALNQGADFLATGHYARHSSDIPLQEACNLVKDQSYFLSLVSKAHLDKVIFPLGDFKSKEDTRKIAASFNLISSQTKDSQDICFIPDNDYKSFLRFCKEPLGKGEIIHIGTKQVLGFHTGTYNYTIGQRKGLRIAYKNPLFVIKLNPATNSVFVGEREFLNQNSFLIKETNWLQEIPESFTASVKLRSSCRKILAEVRIIDEFTSNVKLLEDSEVPVTAGQLCVIYQDQIVLGAGIIIC